MAGCYTQIHILKYSADRFLGQVAVTDAMLAVGSASQLEFCTRIAGVEVLISLAERAPAVMRKCPSLVPGLLPLTLTLACQVRGRHRSADQSKEHQCG